MTKSQDNVQVGDRSPSAKPQETALRSEQATPIAANEGARTLLRAHKNAFETVCRKMPYIKRTSWTRDTSTMTKPLRMLGAMSLLLSLTACKAAPTTVTLDVVTFNYLKRPIYDVFIDGKSGDSSTAYPATGGSTITGVRLNLGPKHVTWKLDGKRGTPRNGETVAAKNPVELSKIAPDAVFLAIHIYPDETVELITSRHYPRKTEKGIAMATVAQR